MINSIVIKGQEFEINATKEQIAAFDRINNLEWKKCFKHVTIRTRKIAPGTVVEIVKMEQIRGYKGRYEWSISVKPVNGGEIVVLAGWCGLVQLEYPSMELIEENERRIDERNNRRWSEM